MNLEARLRNFIRAELDRLPATNYAIARRIPSTRVWNIVEYLSKLGAEERAALFDAFSGNGLFLLVPDRKTDLHAFEAGDRAYLRFCEGMARMPNRRLGVRALRMIRGMKGTRVAEDWPDEIIREAELVGPVSASEIRKAAKAMLTQQFTATAENKGGGEWTHSGKHKGRNFQVQVDYGGRSDQFRYELFFQEPAMGIQARRLTYEGLLGIGFGGWDYLTAANLRESVELLSDLIKMLLDIPERLKL